MASQTRPHTPWRLWPVNLSGPQIAVVIGALGILAAMVGASALDATVVIAAPVICGFAILAIARPVAAFVVFLCLLALIPVEQDFLGFYVPNWGQGVVPLLLMGAALYNLRHPERKGFAFNWADLFVAGFIVAGLIGLKTQPGPNTFKFFVNQQAVPAMMYFVAKWLPLDRQRFHLALRWQLVAVMALCAIMVARVATGFDPFYHRFGFLGLGGEAIGPMGNVADTVAYVAIFPVLFLYALAVSLGAPRPGEAAAAGIGRRIARRWWIGLILALLATLATTERTGPLAIALGFGLAVFSRRLFRPVAIIALALPLAIPLWMMSPMGQKATERLQTLKEEGAGFERGMYRKKALDYTKSPYWNPIVGTGFGRLTKMCVKTMPEDEWFYDYNWADWRQLREFADRPTHCSPITLYAEYGYAGIVTLGGFALCVLFGLARTRSWARRRGKRHDHALLVACLAALVGVFANGMFHNTESVVEVLFLLWSFSGIVIGHPEVFAAEPEPAAQVEPTEQSPALRTS